MATSSFFDGAACMERSEYVKSIDSKSSIRYKMKNIPDPIPSATVEFWFKRQVSNNYTNYLFTLYNYDLKAEYFVIY